MTDKGTQNDSKPSTNGWASFQRHRSKLIFGAVLLSVLAHFVSVQTLTDRRHPKLFTMNQSKRPPVKIRVIEKPKPKVKEEDPDSNKIPNILETPQQKTERPDDAAFVGVVDHKTKKEMRIADEVKRDRAKDPGQKGRPNAAPDAVVQRDRPEQLKPQKNPKSSDIQVKSKAGSLSMDAFRNQPRNDYEALLPTSISDLAGQVNAGFQDFVDDKVQQGDRIDINTTEYRFIGYFTNMRKAIELVWNYPSEASQRGMQGEVGLEFAINKDGKATRIRVIKSSGYPILDRAIVEAIKLASPFSPLPNGFGRDKIVVTGSFRYILSAYGSH